MLYDPKWEKPEVKSDPYTLPALIAWLETMPVDGTYNYHDCEGACLLDQYISSVTGKPSTPTFKHWTICGDEHGYNYTAIARRSPYTFGSALKRARECLSAPRTDFAA